MKIGLASYEFINNDITFNLSQMEKAMKSVQGRADLLCFGETFVQGFDALNWNYEHDRHTAISADSKIMKRLCSLTVKYQVDLLFGYIERESDGIYSSCAVIENGKLVYNYRRISKGWKECAITDEHYREGTQTSEFLYHGQPIMISLCGDLWEFPQRFQTAHLLIWPVYVNFGLKEWEKEEIEYARQAQLAAGRTLMVNSISKNPKSHGGAFYFADGTTAEKSAYDAEEILIVEVSALSEQKQ